MRLIVYGTIMALYKLFNLRKSLFKASLHGFRQVKRRLFRKSWSLSRRRLLRNITVRHHHYHWHSLPWSNQVIKNFGSTSRSNPRFFIASHAMKQVKNGILLFPFFVACRCVNRHATVETSLLWRIPHACYCAMRHIACNIRIWRCFANEEIIHYICYIAHLKSVQRIVCFHTVNRVPIIVKFRL